jgi:hypothetical protein
MLMHLGPSKMRIISAVYAVIPLFAFDVYAHASVQHAQDTSGYAARLSGGGFEAANRGQGLVARFTAKEVSVGRGSARWSWALRAYGYSGSMKPVAPVTPLARFNRLEYNRGALTEWYVNRPEGLEQGFTLRQRPGRSNGEPLNIAIGISGNLKASLDGDGKSLTLTDQRGDKLRYGGLNTYDRDGRELSSWLELHGETLCIRVADEGAAFPITIDPTLEATLTASPAGTFIGSAVSISGNTVVSAGSQGLYVYVKAAGGWSSMTQTALLTASDGAAFNSVAASGNTIAAGSANGVYVFVQPAGGWVNMTQTAKLTASDSPTYGFGSVAINAGTVLGGAPENNSIGARVPPGQPAGTVGNGAVYVFEKPAGGWTDMIQTAELTATDGVPGDDLGFSVSLSGNVAVAGAPNANVGGNSYQGAVYVFAKPAAGWIDATQTAKLTGTYVESIDVLGQSVSISGNTVLAGGYGLAYVFVEPAGGWANTNVQNASLTDSAGRGQCQVACFGYSVSIDSAYAVVGAPGKYSPGLTAAADIYRKPAGGWINMSQTGRVHSPIDSGHSSYGWSISISGVTFAVGYPDQFGSGNYVFVY